MGKRKEGDSWERGGRKRGEKKRINKRECKVRKLRYESEGCERKHTVRGRGERSERRDRREKEKRK